MPADKILLHIDVLNAFSLDFPLYCKDHVMQILSCNHFCLCLNLLVQFQTSRDWTLPCLFYICIKPAYCTKIVKWTEWIFDFLLLREDRDLDSAFWEVPTLSAKTSDFIFLHNFFFSVELFLFSFPTDFRESLAANRCSFIACLFNSFNHPAIGFFCCVTLWSSKNSKPDFYCTLCCAFLDTEIGC